MAHTISGASLDGIYNRLNSIQRHHPLEAETFSDWSVEAGDIVTISRDGKSYQSPIHSSTIKWKGKTPTVSVNSTGNEKREAVSKVSRQKYNRGGSGLRNSQKIYGDVWSEDGHLHSFVNQTASMIYGYVEDVYARMQSGIKLTSSSAALYVRDAYKQMTSGLALTSSSAALYVRDAYKQVTSGLALTSSSAALYVNDAYRQMTSGLALTSSSAALYVRDAYKQMTSGLALTSSSARMYAKSAENAAEIVARINKSTGESEIQLDAQKVYIGNQKSTTVINGKLNASDFTADTVKTRIESITGRLTVKGGVVSSNFYLTGDEGDSLKDAFKNCLSSVSGNTVSLEFTTIGGTKQTVTFSKPTSKVSGRWSGRNYIVSADSSGQNLPITGIIYDGIVPVSGTERRSGATMYKYFKVFSDNGENEADVEILNKEVSIYAGDVWDAAIASRVRSTRDATGQEITIKTLDYGQRWTIVDQFKNASGADGEKTVYTVASPTDANLVAGNIKSGVTIFGVAGSYSPSPVYPDSAYLTSYAGHDLYWYVWFNMPGGGTYGPKECDAQNAYNAGDSAGYSRGWDLGHTQGVEDGIASLHVSGVARSADYEPESQSTQSLITENKSYFYKVNVRDANNSVRFSYVFEVPVSVSDSNPEKHHTSVTFTRGDPVDPGGNAYRYYADIGNNITGGKSSVTFWI